SARSELLTQHLPYARVIAAMVYGQRPNNDVDFDDYLQLARVGLLEAFDRYDPDSGAQFRTFAARRMRGMVLDGLTRLTEREQQQSVRRRLLSERTDSIAGQRGDTFQVALDASAHRTNGSAKERSDLFRHLAEVGVGLALGFMLEDSGMFAGSEERATGPDPAYHAVELRHTKQQLRALVRHLPASERRVIELHYVQGQAFDDIARDLGLTKGRISQIHKKALGNLRELFATRQACDRIF
ncbi:MAG TPA: sigma-70 family RNA polymerase sigma factor, partial [Ideonella sp.]|nr:sigma-70 family RNA polymerase sigma factor [Ideonella sp.]